MRSGLPALLALASAGSALPAAPEQDFSQRIRPVLVQNCASCHNFSSAKGPANFLKATTVKDIETDRRLWRSLAAQLRNRTMPPVASKLTEEDRLGISTWVENQLRQTACNAGDFAGPAVVRRLNRREYQNTIRDLLGLNFEASTLFPADGTGGAGFDTNGETLFAPPMLTERYLGAAEQVLDRVIVAPPLSRTFTAAEMKPMATMPIYMDGDYDVEVSVEAGSEAPKMSLQVDGAEVGALIFQQRRSNRAGAKGGPRRDAIVRGSLSLHLGRGTRSFSITSGEPDANLISCTIRQRQEPPSPDKRVLHYRLLGLESGEQPLQPRKAMRQLLDVFLPRAFRRPIKPSEVDGFLKLYDRAADRGDPYEERVKLALKAVLVWPDFLFRMEEKHDQPGIYPLSQYELAARLSYFLWSTMPDERLVRLAEQGALRDPKTLAAQVERMLDDPRSRTFVKSFIGQWLGTQDIGGRVVPLIAEIQSYYDADVAADLRSQPILLFDRLFSENRSLVELLSANYSYLTPRLVKFYQLEGKVKNLTGDGFQLVEWPDDRRGGLLGLAGVLAMSSRYEQTSPVLRGAWVLDTLLGTPVPPPPPEVPPLKAETQSGVKLSMRQRQTQHRENTACAACHNLMDPIGFGLENFDWMGRWREKEVDGKPIDATGALPSGEKFNGAVELRQALIERKNDFIRHLAGKVLGYALGRSLQDGDSCTVQRIVETLEKDKYRARTLIREIVLSIPFRNTQGGIIAPEPVISRSLNISKLTSLKQDAASHLNAVKDAADLLNGVK